MTDRHPPWLTKQTMVVPEERQQIRAIVHAGDFDALAEAQQIILDALRQDQ